jgi:PIN domain nuclease of toxin-antitoxin system
VNYLLDTHTFLWFINDDPMLSADARKTLEDVDHRLYFSMASLWEMAIKISLDKLIMPEPFDEFVQQQIEINGFQLLNIGIQHTTIVASLPFHHRDPFDRLLIAQSMYEKMPLISKDIAFDAYEVRRIW